MSGLPLPDDAQVTLTVGQLRDLLERKDRSTFDGVPTAIAADLTGESSRTLRRLWTTWDRIQHDGRRPEIRVSRKSGASKSDLLFDRGDCQAYGEKRSHKPPAPPSPSLELPPPPQDENDVDGIVEGLLASREPGRAS